MTLLLHNSNGTASWLQSQIKAWSLSRIFGPEPFLRQSWRKTHKWSLPQQLCVKKCLRLSDFPRTHSFSCRQRPHDPASEESFTRQSHRRKRGFEKPLKKASHLLRAQEDLPSVPWMEKSTGTLLKSCSGCFACLLSSCCQEKMDLLHFSNYWSDIYLCFICFLCAKLGDLCRYTAIKWWGKLFYETLRSNGVPYFPTNLYRKSVEMEASRAAPRSTFPEPSLERM